MNSKWLKRAALLAALSLLASFLFVNTLVGRNDLHTWQVVQYLNGTVEVKNEPGWYWRGFAQVTTYPEMMEVFCTKKSILESPLDDSARVPFNDGGYADLDWYCRVILPKVSGKESADEQKTITEIQRNFHRQFRSAENAKIAIRSHGRDCISRSGATMSSTENQATRKGEFYENVSGQFRNGYYKMQKVTIRRKDSMAEMIRQAEKNSTIAAAEPGVEAATPKPKTSSGSVSVQQPTKVVGEKTVEATDTVLAAEIVKDKAGMPVIMNPSPLIQYGMKVLQFSISATEYDVGTQAKFTAKKGFLLEAEKNKADAVRNAQQRLLTIAEGDRKVAETEWKANESKAKKVIEARQKQEVATIGKKLVEVEGQTRVKVAQVKAKVSEIEKGIAEKKAQIAENQKSAAELLAQAKEQMLDTAGAASDYEKTLLEIQLAEIEAIAEAFANLQVPDTVIMSAEGIQPGTSPLASALVSLQLLEANGLMKRQDSIVPSKWRPEEKRIVPITPPATASKQ